MFTPERFPQRFTPLTRAILVITEGKCGVPVHGGKINTLCGGPKALKAWGWSSLETLLTAAVRYGLIDTMIQKDQLLVTLHPPRYMENKAASEIDDHTAGSPARSPPERLKVASKYLPIVVSILNKSDNRFEFPVHAEPVAQDLGGNKRCRALGWSSYGVYEDVAAKQGYVAITSLGKGSSRLLAAKVCWKYLISPPCAR